MESHYCALVTDDLFTPTVRDSQAPTEKPWNPDSIVYAAFFGGPLAGAVLGILNGRKLLLSRSHLLLIALAGVVAIAGRLVFTAWQGHAAARIGGAMAGVLVWLVVNALQRKAFRAAIHNGLEPASLVGPGIAAAIGCGLIEVILIVAVAW
jgi:hypothetical protein